jgi:hypothetical protein
MTDPNGDPSIEGQSSATPTGDPGQAEPGQSQTGGADKYAKFRGEDGNLDPERILESYTNVEQEKGRLANEVGQLRQANEGWAEWKEGNFVETPDGGLISKAEYERQNAQPNPNPSDTDFVETIRDQWDENPMTVLEAHAKFVEDRLLGRLSERDAAFSDPLLANHPDIREEAERVSRERGMSYDDAVTFAMGKKTRSAATGNTANTGPALAPGQIPSRDTSSFIPPAGTPPQTPNPEDTLTDEEIAFAKEWDMTPERYLARKKEGQTQ